jgi:pimeloyl-ACP methyl ester carboxylesterase
MQLVAARHSNCVAGLVLLEPADPDEWMHPSDAQRQQIARGTRLCRHGAQAARLGVGKALAALVSAGAVGTAWAVVKVVSRGGLGRADESILAPIWKLPPANRLVLKEMWTQPKFFEALGSQIASISESAGEVLRETPGHFGNLPLIVLTGAGAQERRMRADAALAARSTRGRHVIVPDSGHWIPLDAPDAVVRVVTDLVNEIRAGLPAR